MTSRNGKGETMTKDEMERRFTYHRVDADQADAHATIRLMGRQLAETVDELCPEGREKALAVTNIEQAVMWANAAISRQEED